MNTPAARWVRDDFRGLPGWRASLPSGRDSVFVADQGAQVLSWIADGEEQFYCSQTAVLDGQHPIRGGVPVCMPQFNQRGPLPKHGFARTMVWNFEALDDEDLPLDLPPGATMGLWVLEDDAQTHALWPHDFEMTLGVALMPGALTLSLSLHNGGSEPMRFTGALHSYFRVDSLAAACVTGLDQALVWDAVHDVRGVNSGELRFDAEFDRVYTPALGKHHRLRLHRGTSRSLDIVQTEAWSDTVVWNPGAAKAAALSDIEAGGFDRFVCIEAACVHHAVTVAPGADWQGAQILVLARP